MEQYDVLRMLCFAVALTGMASWEAWRPRRARALSRRRRWPSHFGLVALNTAAHRLLLPGSAFAMGVLAEERGWGLLPILPIPTWAALAIAVVALDFAIYLQHVLFHAVPPLWRLHRVHHADLDFDVTTGVRFHPAEIVLSMGVKMGAVAVLGASALSVLVFEILLNATSLFNHANVHLPLGVDRVLRWGVVTPDMHRVHHSWIPRETNSNFGFNLPWWDWLFRTYRAQPEAGHEGMTIGVPQFRDPRELRLDRILVQPFLRLERGPWIEAADLEARLRRQEDLLVVDVRGADEFVGPLHHIPTARNIALDEVETRLDELERGRAHPIVLVCQTDRRSATAAELLRGRGFRHVFVLHGGMVAWNRAGYATA